MLKKEIDREKPNACEKQCMQKVHENPEWSKVL